jgi:hypothetical protein
VGDAEELTQAGCCIEAGLLRQDQLGGSNGRSENAGHNPSYAPRVQLHASRPAVAGSSSQGLLNCSLTWARSITASWLQPTTAQCSAVAPISSAGRCRDAGGELEWPHTLAAATHNPIDLAPSSLICRAHCPAPSTRSVVFGCRPVCH